tara:strand:+ start:157 stop:501 length:345 start_codon:yes stop_codon:yes gene_type:complete
MTLRSTVGDLADKVTGFFSNVLSDVVDPCPGRSAKDISVSLKNRYAGIKKDIANEEYGMAGYFNRNSTVKKEFEENIGYLQIKTKTGIDKEDKNNARKYYKKWSKWFSKYQNIK